MKTGSSLMKKVHYYTLGYFELVLHCSILQTLGLGEFSNIIDAGTPSYACPCTVVHLISFVIFPCKY